MTRSNRRRIVVHDYAGHPFQVQLSRELARRGHAVLHLYSASTHTPRGSLEPRSDDPADLRIEAVSLGEQVAKYSFLRRRRQETEYGRLLAERVGAFEPDVVLSGNTPPDAQRRLQAFARGRGIRFVFWMQDAFGEGITRVLRRKLPVVGAPIAWYYRTLERRLLAGSDGIVLITEDFRSLVPGGARDRTVTIPNWAPLDEVPVLPKDNAWAREHGLSDTRNLIYTGTLGLKHDPGMLVALGRAMADRQDVRVVVVSEGPVVETLKAEVADRGLPNVRFFDFQPFERLPEVLAAADVLVALLEKDAGAYAVPSKVLTYLCARRALLLAVPGGNLAARTVLEAGAGRVVEPGDAEAFVEAGRSLLGDAAYREAAGSGARRYAERMFDIRKIADRFGPLLDG